MPTANEQIIVRAYEAFHAGDMDTIRNDCFASDITWTFLGSGPLNAVYKDIDGVIGFFGAIFAGSGGSFKGTPESISQLGELVVVRSRASWTDGRGLHDDPYVQVFRFRDGRASECTLLVNDVALWNGFPA